MRIPETSPWARGQLGNGARRWGYCTEGDSRYEDVLVPEAVVASPEAGLFVRADAEQKQCVSIEKAEALPTALSARYAVLSIRQRDLVVAAGAGRSSDRNSGSAPAGARAGRLVLDASRSMQHLDGIAMQLALLEAYLANTPSASLGRFVPAQSLNAAVAGARATAVLRKGSFLERGTDLAPDILARTGGLGVILMSDGELRSRFDMRAVMATLNALPRGPPCHAER
jgi:hypothetical protein